MPVNLKDVQVLGEEREHELRLCEGLRPFLGQCLTLNHDINNALGGIIGFAECLLVEEPLTESQRETVEWIMTCASQIQTKMEELCRLKQDLLEDGDLKELVRTCCKKFNNQTN